jgi:hypothetical protein
MIVELLALRQNARLFERPVRQHRVSYYGTVFAETDQLTPSALAVDSRPAIAGFTAANQFIAESRAC